MGPLKKLRRALSGILVALIPSCHESSGGTSGTVESPGPVTLAGSLESLGVEVKSADTPRLDSDGIPYPESYGPFGARFEMTELPDGSVIYGRPAKLMLIGYHLRGRLDTLYALDNIARPPAPSTTIVPTVLRDGAPEWAREISNVELGTGTLRDAVACDVDGDGNDELVFVHVSEDEVRLQVVQGDDDGSKDVDQALPLSFLATSRIPRGSRNRRSWRCSPPRRASRASIRITTTAPRRGGSRRPRESRASGRSSSRTGSVSASSSRFPGCRSSPRGRS